MGDKPQAANSTEWRRCVVTSIITYEGWTDEVVIVGLELLCKPGENVAIELLTLENSVFGQNIVCRLSGVWAEAHKEIALNELIHLLAVWDETNGEFFVNNDNGFLVIKPNVHIPITTLLNGVNCARRAVLRHRYKFIESSNKEFMLFGTLMHRLFALVLQKIKDNPAQASDSLQGVEVCIRLILQQSLVALRACCLDPQEVFRRMELAVPHIFDFVSRYCQAGSIDISTNSKWALRGDFVGKITELHDIEETIYDSRLGLKGKVDAIVTAEKHGSECKMVRKKVPFELKSGSYRESVENLGQVIAYAMMLATDSEFNDDKVEDDAHEFAGLLFYLGDKKVLAVRGGHNERRDLILLRNEIALHWDESLMSLPHPTPMTSTHCSSCPVLFECCLHLNASDETKPTPLMKAFKAKMLAHLHQSDLDYVFKWLQTLTFEAKEGENEIGAQAGGAKLNFFLVSSGKGRTISSERVDDGRAVSKFRWCGEGSLADALGQLEPGNLVYVSTNQQFCVALGSLIDIGRTSVYVATERAIVLENSQSTRFGLRKYHSLKNTFLNMSSLSKLMRPENAKLKELIVDRKRPTLPSFHWIDVSEEDNSRHFNHLSLQQKAVALAALRNDYYYLISGFPGSGKTQIIAAIIAYCASAGKSVLIACHTHLAVDNILRRLRQIDDQVEFLRLGRHSDLPGAFSEFDPNGNSYLTDSTAPYLLDRLTTVLVYASTCLGCDNPLLEGKRFDLCIIDEATQTFHTEILRPLFLAEKFILVGDQNQLPPTIRSPKAYSLGGDETLFARLSQIPCNLLQRFKWHGTLTEQFRMNDDIQKVVNDFGYDGQLTCGSEKTRRATINSCLKEDPHKSCAWLDAAVHNSLEKSFLIVDTGNVSLLEMSRPITQNTTHGLTNLSEAIIMREIIDEMRRRSTERFSLGLITPFNAQSKLLAEFFNDEITTYATDVKTIDKFQGCDKDVVLVSCVFGHRLSPKKKFNSTDTEPTPNSDRTATILKDPRRWNVALSRAKKKIIVLGDFSSLRVFEPFKKLLEIIPQSKIIKLNEQSSSFDWLRFVDKYNSHSCKV